LLENPWPHLHAVSPQTRPVAIFHASISIATSQSCRKGSHECAGVLPLPPFRSSRYVTYRELSRHSNPGIAAAFMWRSAHTLCCWIAGTNIIVDFFHFESRCQQGPCYRDCAANDGTFGVDDRVRILLSSATSLGQSLSTIAVNLNPSPPPGARCRTTASALICPS
jgi:hypothetical protein